MSEQGDLLPMGPGERLRRERLAQKRSLERVAGELHLPVDVVEAIEADRLDRFAPLYRRGYLLSYARLLSLSEERTAAVLAGLDDVTEPRLQPAFSLAPRLRAGDRWLRAAGYVLASLLIGTLAWQLTHEMVRLSQEGADNPASVRAGAADAPAETVETGKHMTASIAALEEIGRSDRAVGAGEEAWQALRGEPQAPVDPEMPAGHVLNIRTSGDSWVEITDFDGSRLEMDLVRGGSERVYQGVGPFEIVFGRASAVQLSLDGVPVDLAAFTRGNVTQMRLEPRQADVAAPDSTGGR